MRAFRIGAVKFSRTRKVAFSGIGGVYSAARWNSAGHPMVYLAQSLSLAALEILVHLKQTTQIQPHCSYAIDIPEVFIAKPKTYPARWQSDVSVSRAFGDQWLRAKTSPALRVPTVITPGEWNILLNPLHPKFSLKWITSGPDEYSFDARLLTPKAESRSRKARNTATS